MAVDHGITFQPVWVAVTGVFMVERIVSVRRRGVKQMALASLLIVEMTFDIFLQAVQARAFWQALRGSATAW